MKLLISSEYLYDLIKNIEKTISYLDEKIAILKVQMDQASIDISINSSIIFERIEKLENYFPMILPNWFISLIERIEKLENHINKIDKVSALVDKHEEYLCKISGMESFDADKLLSNQKILDEKIKELEKMLIEVNSSGKKPHKCPVCDSKGNNSQEV
jgi:hypothetical protein